MIWHRMACGLGGLLAALTLAGCGGPETYHVQGTVTYDGKPLPAGVIWFDPDAAAKNDAPQGFAYVKDGKFNTAENGRGVGGGPYIIRIEGFDGKPGNELPMGMPLFTDFQEKKELNRGPSELHFTIPGKKR